MKRYISIALCVLVAGLAAAQNVESTRYVVVKSAAVKSSAGFFSSIRGYLSEGEAVTLLREQGQWAEIRSANLSGWVASTSLTSKRILSPGRRYSSQEISMAGKGFSAETEVLYKQETQLDYSLIDSMEARRVPLELLLDFLKDGRLAGGD